MTRAVSSSTLARMFSVTATACRTAAVVTEPQEAEALSPPANECDKIKRPPVGSGCPRHDTRGATTPETALERMPARAQEPPAGTS